MRRRPLIVFLALVVLVVTVVTFTRGQSAKVRVTASAIDLITADASFARTAAEQGLEGWLSWFADDAVIFPRRGPIVEGIAAIRQEYAKTGFSPKGLFWRPKRGVIAESGELGYTYGIFKLEADAPDGKKVSATGKYMTVWRRERNGAWKVVADIGAPDLPQ